MYTHGLGSAGDSPVIGNGESTPRCSAMAPSFGPVHVPLRAQSGRHAGSLGGRFARLRSRRRLRNVQSLRGAVGAVERDAATEARLVTQHALEQTGATVDGVTDSSSQFTAQEFTDLIRRFAFTPLAFGGIIRGGTGRWSIPIARRAKRRGRGAPDPGEAATDSRVNTGDV